MHLKQQFQQFFEILAYEFGHLLSLALRRGRSISVLALFTVLTGTFCAIGAQEKELKNIPGEKYYELKRAKEVFELSEANNQFALKFFQELAKEEGNISCCPLSLSMSMGIMLNGAANNTGDEISKVMCWGNNAKDEMNTKFGLFMDYLDENAKEERYTLNMANVILAADRFEIEKEFQETTIHTFRSELHSVNFTKDRKALCDKINEWVDKKTGGNIKEIAKPDMLDEETNFLILNALFFSDRWDCKFNKKNTKDRAFKRQDGSSIDTPTMSIISECGIPEFPYFEDNDVQVLALPYLSGCASMIFILPKKNDGLPDVEKSLTEENWNKWTSFKGAGEYVDMFIPKFRLETDLDVKTIFQKLGLKGSFDPERCDLRRLNNNGGKCCINSIFQKSFVEIDEEGTTAAASTLSSMVKCLSDQRKTFKADHPFLFCIRDDVTGAILFMGRVSDPSLK